MLSCGGTGAKALLDRGSVMTAEAIGTATVAHAGYPHRKESANRVAWPCVCPCSRRAPIWQEALSQVQPIFGGTSSQDCLCQLWRHLSDQLLTARGVLPGPPQSCWCIAFEGKHTKKSRLFPELEDLLNFSLPRTPNLVILGVTFGSLLRHSEP